MTTTGQTTPVQRVYRIVARKGPTYGAYTTVNAALRDACAGTEASGGMVAVEYSENRFTMSVAVVTDGVARLTPNGVRVLREEEGQA